MLTFAKTLDLMRQVRGATRVLDPKSPLLTTLSEGERLMRRGIVALCVGLGMPTAEGILVATP
jgi:hypothetical protein